MAVSNRDDLKMINLSTLYQDSSQPIGQIGKKVKEIGLEEKGDIHESEGENDQGVEDEDTGVTAIILPV